MRLLLIILAILSLSFKQEDVLKVDSKSTIYLVGVLYESKIPVYTQQFQKVVDNNTNKIVNLVINSPGGSTEAGDAIMDNLIVLKESGYTINCVVTGFAMSMAFTILTECTNRYMLISSKFLVHPVKIHLEGTLDYTELRSLLLDLKATDEMCFNKISSSLKIKDINKFKERYNKTIEWNGLQLMMEFPGWSKIISDVEWN